MPTDRSSQWPDRSGFHFDLEPTNYATTQRGSGDQARANFYGAHYVSMDMDPTASGFKPWTNWIDKFQPDPRFAAVSDKNANLYGFPEVDAPWKFTNYTYKGVKDGYITIEPPLYSPKSLERINYITANRTGTMDGIFFAYNEPIYQYQNVETGNIFTEDALRTNGWMDPAASGSPRSFTRIGIINKRYKFKYPSYNKGVNLYKVQLEVESTNLGEHGNIPPHIVNMSAPEEYFEPSNIYSNTVVPKYTATMGSPVYAETDGVIRYDQGSDMRGLYKAYIAPITATSEAPGPSGRFQEYTIDSIGTEVLQPRPQTSRATVLQMKFIGSDYSNGDYVHQGCAFFQGNQSGTVKCTIADQIDTTKGVNVPGFSSCSTEGNTTCPYHQDNGPREIAFYESMAQTSGEWAAMWAGIDNYNMSAGKANRMNGSAIFAGSNLPVGGPMLMHGGFALGAQAAFVAPMDSPRQMGDVGLRWKVEWEFKKIPADGREVYNDHGIMLKYNDYDQYRRGTGKMALDDHEYSYGGIDTNFYGERNMLSAWRWNSCTLHCYKADKCNAAFGHQMTQGWTSSKFADVDGEGWCRYYNQGCPKSTVPRRAWEFDRHYRNAMHLVLTPFRSLGMDAFPLLTEYQINSDGSYTETDDSITSPSGVFVAVGITSDALGVEHISNAPSSGKYIFFYYKCSRWAEDNNDHKECDVYVHIKQYDYDGDQLYLNLPASGVSAKPDGYPSNVPWLVKLDEDYKSPVTSSTYVTNENRFFGGRCPEYKDRSKMDGTEVFGMAAVGGGMFDTQNGKAGDPKYSYEDKGYGRGYWIDKTGEYIVDGRALGDVAPSGYTPSGYTGGDPPTPLTGDYSFKIVDVNTRLSMVPPVSEGATPIDGNTSNSFITPEKTISAKVTEAYSYSSDTRDVINSYELQHLEDEDGKSIRMSSPPAGQLPTERHFYRCPTCSSGYSGTDMDGGGTDVNDGTDFYCENISVNQIYTDFEAESLSYTCPVCSDTLVDEGNWTHFPKVKARGVVSVWGLPGQSVQLNGYYWKNPTIVNRSMVTQIINKIGPISDGGTGYTLGAASASAATEAAVSWYTPASGNYWLEGKHDPSYSTEEYWKTDGDTIQSYSRDPVGFSDGMTAMGMSMTDKNRLDGGTYADNMISPYDTDVPGLDIVTLNTIKQLRNRMEPMFGYMVGKRVSKDYYPMKQPKHRDRYGEQIERKFAMKPGTLSPEIIAANTYGRQQYSQYWDGQFPGQCVREYYPTGMCWWRIHGYIGGIARAGGNNVYHLDDEANAIGGMTNETNYTGNVVSKAYFFLHGWLPLDKDVVKAYAILTPAGEPSFPPIGTVFSGRTIRYHYHPFRTSHEDSGDGNWYTYPDSESSDATKPNTQWIDDYPSDADALAYAQDCYASYMYNYTSDDFTETMQYLHGFWDENYGFDLPNRDWADTLSWDGCGEDLVQNYTEEQVWKTKTFAEFREEVRKDLMKCTFVAGDPEKSGASYDFYINSRRMLNEYFNNELQPIPGYFDLSGMNSKLMYPKNGPMVEQKVSDTAWAEGGQIIIQSGKIKPAAGTMVAGSSSSATWSDGGFGNASSGWIPRVLDITDLIKEKYNARLDRAYTASGGLTYSEIGSNLYTKRFTYDETNPGSVAVNYRYWISGFGEWLNDPWHYPLLSNDEFPNQTKERKGDPYEFDPDGRIYSVSEWYRSAEAFSDEDHADYYKYHPKAIITADPSGCTSESVPSPSGYWYVKSDLDVNQSFAYDLMPFPIERTRRNWRYEKGHWDCSNAVCPNLNCAIGYRGQTVSEFIEWAQATGHSSAMPSLTGTRCVYCNSDLTSPPATGAQYVDGDGILTVDYYGLPEKNVFISAVDVNPTDSGGLLSSFKNDFSVEVMSDGDCKWRRLFNVEYMPDTGKWRYGTYDSSKNLVYSEHSSLPSSFIGGFTNGCSWENASGSELEGKNFIVPRARYIRYTYSPRKIALYYPSDSGASFSSLTVDGRYVKPPGVTFLDGEWDNGHLEISTDFSDPDQSLLVIATDPSGVYLSSDIEGTPTSLYRIKKDFFISGCGKFNAYGYETIPGDVYVTGSADVMAYPIPVGSRSILLASFPSKIIEVSAGLGDMVTMPMYERESTSASDFYWNVADKYDTSSGNTYKTILYGFYVFNPKTAEISFPTQWKDFNTGEIGNIWGINDDLDNDPDFKKDVVPQFIYVRYMTGNGKAVTLPATAVGPGPSYQVEKEAVCNIAGYEPSGSTPALPSGVATTGSLPSMGYSVKLGSTFSTRKQMYWQVYNHEPLYGEFTMGYIKGTELGPGGWQDANYAKLFGGMTQDNPRADSKISGRVSGEVTFYGIPDAIISGNIVTYAKALTTRRYTVNGESVVTYERTGGLKYTGFAVGTEFDAVTDTRQSICFGVPDIIVYLAERDNTVEPSMS